MSEVLAVDIIEANNSGEFSGSFEMNNQKCTVGLERVVIERN